MGFPGLSRQKKRPTISDASWWRRLTQQIGDSGEIGFGFDPGAKNSGKLTAKILIGAGMADDDGTDDCCLPLLRLASVPLVPDGVPACSRSIRCCGVSGGRRGRPGPFFVAGGRGGRRNFRICGHGKFLQLSCEPAAAILQNLSSFPCSNIPESARDSVSRMARSEAECHKVGAAN